MSNDESLLSIATRIAKDAHSGQFRRDGITPYFEHPWRVQKRLENESVEIRCAALLHDVIEDTKWSICDLQSNNVRPEVIEAVRVLTKANYTTFADAASVQNYEEYLALVKANPIARAVKIADMLDNLSDAPTTKQIIKYAKGLLFLTQ